MRTRRDEVQTADSPHTAHDNRWMVERRRLLPRRQRSLTRRTLLPGSRRRRGTAQFAIIQGAWVVDTMLDSLGSASLISAFVLCAACRTMRHLPCHRRLHSDNHVSQAADLRMEAWSNAVDRYYRAGLSHGVQRSAAGRPRSRRSNTSTSATQQLVDRSGIERRRRCRPVDER